MYMCMLQASPFCGRKYGTLSHIATHVSAVTWKIFEYGLKNVSCWKLWYFSRACLTRTGSCFSASFDFRSDMSRVHDICRMPVTRQYFVNPKQRSVTHSHDITHDVDAPHVRSAFYQRHVTGRGKGQASTYYRHIDRVLTASMTTYTSRNVRNSTWITRKYRHVLIDFLKSFALFTT